MEKNTATHENDGQQGNDSSTVERGDVSGLPGGVSDRKLTLKIDLHLIPVLSIMYLFSFLDRTNIGNANIYGMTEDLKLTKLRYNTALVIFFVSYCTFEIPSNILLKKFRPSRWLSGCMFLFGFVTLCQGLVTSYGGLLAARFFLGVAEAGVFPGCFYVISMYYRREQAQRRYTFFFSSTTLAGAFGGLLAYGIGHIHHPILNSHPTGLAGVWRYVFIIEGGTSTILAILFWFIIPDFPEQAKWLSETERGYLKARLAANQGRSGIEQKITAKAVGRVFYDWKIFLIAFVYFGTVIAGYSYAYFSPVIIKGYGYSPIRTQLISVPPWAAAFVFANIIAFCSDKLRHRFLFTLFPLLLALCGVAVNLSIHDRRHIQYGALFLIACGAYTALAQTICWSLMNTSGHVKRSVTSAFTLGFGNLGGIVAVFIFPAADAPKYTMGYAVSLGFLAFSIICLLAYFMVCLAQNRAKAKMINQGDITEEESLELGDMVPSFKYML